MAPETHPKDGHRGASSRAAARVALVLVVAALIPAALLGYARARGRGDWPEPMPPAASAPESPVPTSEATWPALEEAIERAPHDESRLGELLSRDDTDPSTPAVAEALRPYADSVRALDRATAMPAALLPRRRTFDAPGPRYVGLIRAFNAALLLNRSRPPGEAAAALARYERFASRFAFGGESLLTAMIGVALESRALREVERLQRRGVSLTPAELAPLAAALDEAVALPSALPHAYASECAVAEALLQSAGSEGAWRLTGLNSGGAPPSGSGGLGGLVARLSYDKDRTIAAHRARCRARVDALAALGLAAPRSVPAGRVFLHPNAGSFWERFDNHTGRVLLDIGEMAHERFAAREESVIAARHVARVAVALQRRAGDGAAPPESLAALAPAYLSAPPPAVLFGRAVEWSPSLRRISLGPPPRGRALDPEGERVLPIAWEIHPSPPAPAPTAASATPAAVP